MNSRVWGNLHLLLRLSTAVPWLIELTRYNTEQVRTFSGYSEDVAEYDRILAGQ